MAGFNYGRMQKTASRLIDRFSEQTIQLDRVVGATVVAGVDTPGSDEQYNVAAVITPYLANQVDSTNIQSGDLQIVIKFDIEPLMNDKLTIDGDTYKIVSIERFKPSLTALGYRIQVRK